jgi:hypothetical protein
MIPPSVYTAPIIPVRVITGCLLQVTSHGMSASVINIIGQFIAIPVISTILYFTDKTNPVRLVWCYVYSDAAATVAALAIGTWQMRREDLSMLDTNGSVTSALMVSETEDKLSQYNE